MISRLPPSAAVGARRPAALRGLRSGIRAERSAAGLKRLVDACVAAGLLLALLPLFALVWLLIKLDDGGPVLHRGERLGEGGSTFACLKFRTMHLDGEARLQQLLDRDAGMARHFQVYRKLPRDPRVTRVGSWLRCSSIDELPQLWNVLCGDMSLVGPRPYLVEERERIGEWLPVVLAVRPGLTGYWQVSGRADIPFDERVRMEGYYARHRSLRWDLAIFAATPLAVLARRGAR